MKENNQKVDEKIKLKKTKTVNKEKNANPIY